MKTLVIGIPTYNRCIILEENLREMLPLLNKYNVHIYVYDDSPNDDTKNMIAAINKDCDQQMIYYHKNIPRLGHDKNCIKVLENTPGDYIWYLGDSFIISEEGFNKVKNLIDNEENDAIILTSNLKRTKLFPSKKYLSSNDFYREISWHATLTDVTIYNKNMINDIFSKIKFDKYINSNFMQLAILLEGINKNNITITYLNNAVITLNKKRKGSYWLKNSITTFCVDWYDFNMNLPLEYTIEDKKVAIANHDKYTRIFSSILTIYMYGSNFITLNQYYDNKEKCDACITTNRTMFFNILKSPKIFSRLLVMIYNKVKV